jgi:hypothetical protein
MNDSNYIDIPNAVEFDYVIDMRNRGRADIKVDYVTLDVFFTVSNFDDWTGLTGPVLVGKFTDLTQNPSIYSAFEYQSSTGLHEGFYQLGVTSDQEYLIGVGHF